MSAERTPTEDYSPALAHARRALAFAVEGRERDAVVEADAAAALAPAAAWVHTVRSAALREAGRQRDALRAAKEAVRLAPEDPAAHRVLAAALAAAGRIAEAREAARAAERLAPDDAAVIRGLGDVSLAADPAAAERYYRRSLSLDPHSVAARAGLARALRRLGRHDEADAQADRAMAADPAARDLRTRASALLPILLQGAAIAFLLIAVLGWVPGVIAVYRPDLRGTAAVAVMFLAAAAAVALLVWSAARVRALSRSAPIAPELREDLLALDHTLATKH